MADSAPMADSNLDVSLEEQRYLRKAFRRFAWPYLLASLLALGLGASAYWTVSKANPAGMDSSQQEALISESASLRDALASLRQEVDARGEQTGSLIQRIESLDVGLAEVSQQADASPNLETRLEAAHRRINALEGRVAKNPAEGLVGRLAGFEDRLAALETPPVRRPSLSERLPEQRPTAPIPEPWPPANSDAP